MTVRIRGKEGPGLSEEDISRIIARLIAAIQWESLDWAMPQTFEEILVGDGGITFYGGAGALAATLAGSSALSNPTYTITVA